MNDEQYDWGIRAQSSRPNRVPALLSVVVHTVWTHKAAFVFKKPKPPFRMRSDAFSG
jgi:hypothetical protein